MSSFELSVDNFAKWLKSISTMGKTDKMKSMVNVLRNILGGVNEIQNTKLLRNSWDLFQVVAHLLKKFDTEMDNLTGEICEEEIAGIFVYRRNFMENGDAYDTLCSDEEINEMVIKLRFIRLKMIGDVLKHILPNCLGYMVADYYLSDYYSL